MACGPSNCGVSQLLVPPVSWIQAGPQLMTRTEHSMAHSSDNAPSTRRPFLEIRCGGVRLVVQHVPYKLITAVTTVAGAVAGSLWLQH